MLLLLPPTLLLLLTTLLLDTFANLDLATLHMLNGGRATDLDFPLLTLTITAYGLGALVPLCLYLVGHFRKLVSLKLKAYQYVFAMGLNILFICLLEYTVDRPRPFVTHDTIEQIAEASSPSFPSGHTAFVFTAAVVLVLMFRNPTLRGLVLTWALLIAYSRLAVGVPTTPATCLASCCWDLPPLTSPPTPPENTGNSSKLCSGVAGISG